MKAKSKVILRALKAIYCCVKISCVGLLLFFSSALSAQSEEQTTSEYDVKAVFLFHFFNFANWPAQVSKLNVHNICIYGDNPFNGRLELLANANLQSKPVIIRSIASIGESKNCHLLFIDDSAKQQLPVILKKVQSRPVLTVSDIKNFAVSEGMIELKVVAGKVKLQVNLAAVRASGIKINSNLLEVAKVL